MIRAMLIVAEALPSSDFFSPSEKQQRKDYRRYGRGKMRGGVGLPGGIKVNERDEERPPKRVTAGGAAASNVACLA